jgi:hypothetical protein
MRIGQLYSSTVALDPFFCKRFHGSSGIEEWAGAGHHFVFDHPVGE